MNFFGAFLLCHFSVPQCWVVSNFACFVALETETIENSPTIPRHFSKPYSKAIRRKIHEGAGKVSDREIERGITERGGVRICLPVHCLSVRPDRQPCCHTNSTSPPCFRERKFQKHININKFAGLSPDRAKICLCVFFGSFLMGEKKHINKIPPKIPGQSPENFVYVLFLYVLYSLPSLLKDDQVAHDNRLPVQSALAVAATLCCQPGRHAASLPLV